jgi:hypothetical protein
MPEGCTIELLDSVRIGSGKREVEARAWRLMSFGTMLESQRVATARNAVSGCLIGLSRAKVRPHADISQRRKGRIVECGCAFDVGHSERQVMDHA